jgi:hypothetical protein
MLGARRIVPAALIAAWIVPRTAAADEMGPAPTPTTADDRPTSGASPTPITEEVSRPRRWSIDGGFALQNVYGMWITAGALEIDYTPTASATRLMNAGLIVEGTYGSTQYGIPIQTLRLGGFGEGFVGPLRLGVGLLVGVFDAVRATGAGFLASVSAGVQGRAAIDLDGDGRFYLFLRGGLDAVGTNDTLVTGLYSALAGVGARL